MLRDWSGSEEEQARLARERQLGGNLLVRDSRVLLPSHGGPNSLLAAQLVDLAWPESADHGRLFDRTQHSAERARGEQQHEQLEPEQQQLVFGGHRGPYASFRETEVSRAIGESGAREGDRAVVDLDR